MNVPSDQDWSTQALKGTFEGIDSLTLAEKMAPEEAAGDAVAKEMGALRLPAARVHRIRAEGQGPRRLPALAVQGCGRRFSAKTMGLPANSKLAPKAWSAHIGDMLSGASLRACAGRYGVSLKALWFMHMRLCEVIERSLQPFRTGDAVSWQVDVTYLA